MEGTETRRAMTVVAFALAVLVTACAEQGRDTDSTAAPDTAEVAPAPEAEGDTAAAAETAGGPTETGRRLEPAELSVDSIADAYRGHYLAELVDRQTAERASVEIELDPEVAQAAERRTALQFGYVEIGGWEELQADLTAAQRSELTARVEGFHRSLREGRPATGAAEGAGPSG